MLNTETQTSLYVANQYLDTLRAITTDVHFESDGSVYHPAFKPLRLSKELAMQLGQMPLDLQNKYLCLQLRSFIYGVYYNASMRSALALDSDAESVIKDLDNSSALGVKAEFFEELHGKNHGEGYFDAGWRVLSQEHDGRLRVNKNGLSLSVDRDQHLKPSDRAVQVGVDVAVYLPKNRVQNGFYVAIGNTGPAVDDQVAQGIVRVYFNISSEGASEIMSGVTRYLNELVAPFSFKTLYNPDNYQRYDCAVLYIQKQHYQIVQPVLQLVYRENQQYFRPDTPLFTKRLAPGLGLAEEPSEKFTARESFGLNRCQMVAEGLLDAQRRKAHTPEQRSAAVLAQFEHRGIDVQRPYLNPAAEDIYQLLDLHP